MSSLRNDRASRVAAKSPVNRTHRRVELDDLGHAGRRRGCTNRRGRCQLGRNQRGEAACWDKTSTSKVSAFPCAHCRIETYSS